MSYIFPVYDLGRDTTGAIPVPGATKLYPYVPAPEPGYDHWQLGGGAASLVPYGGTATLNSVGTENTWGQNYVQTPSYGNALVSNVADAREQTFYAAFRYLPVAGKNVIVVGNITLASEGAGIWVNASGNLGTVLRNSSGTVLYDHGIPNGVAPGDWIFVGLSKYVENGVSKTRTLIGNNVYEKDWGALQTVSPGHRIAVGNPATNTTIYTPAELRTAELLIRQAGADSVAKMLDVYAHSRVRLQSRGISLR